MGKTVPNLETVENVDLQTEFSRAGQMVMIKRRVDRVK